mmetsp:Transcript_39427/g.73998  ORF Transcript_39427/g.73998 Transcript_39427/m.73998 type:complete len:114 (+) Transcript_39427:654-995(+)
MISDLPKMADPPPPPPPPSGAHWSEERVPIIEALEEQEEVFPELEEDTLEESTPDLPLPAITREDAVCWPEGNKNQSLYWWYFSLVMDEDGCIANDFLAEGPKGVKRVPSTRF